MLTAARVVAAILMAGLGFIVSEQIKQIMPEGTGFGWFSVVNAVVGAACGWMVNGPRAGQGYVSAINNGFTATAAMVFWGLFVQGVYHMWIDANRRRFDDMVEAVVSVFERMLEFGQIMLNAQVILPLVVGAVVIGILVEAAGRAWR